MKKIKLSPIKKAGGRVLVTVLAALSFIGLLYAANMNRPTYQSSDTSGIEYEVGKVTGILADNTTIDENNGGIWRGSMELQV